MWRDSVGPDGSKNGCSPHIPRPTEKQTWLQEQTQSRFLPRAGRGRFVLLNLFKSDWPPGGENGSSIFIKFPVNTLPL